MLNPELLAFFSLVAKQRVMSQKVSESNKNGSLDVGCTQFWNKFDFHGGCLLCVIVVLFCWQLFKLFYLFFFLSSTMCEVMKATFTPALIPLNQFQY